MSACRPLLLAQTKGLLAAQAKEKRERELDQAALREGIEGSGLPLEIVVGRERSGFAADAPVPLRQQRIPGSSVRARPAPLGG